MPEPSLSIVVAANGAPGSVERCLAALAAQVDGAEVLVCGAPTDEAATTAFPFARFLPCTGELVPERWRDGIDASAAEVVALTISPMEPAPDWVATLRALHAGRDVVGGAIEPGARLRLGDWAEYFCRYSRDMLAFPGHDCLDLPGDNASYKRVLLERTRADFRDGFWEPVVHRRLHADGVTLWHDPTLVVSQGRSAGTGVFVRQRWTHGRIFGRQRGAGRPFAANAARAAAAPAVTAVVLLRQAREVFGKGRNRLRFVAALPLLLVFDAAWALGEGLGHLEAGRSR